MTESPARRRAVGMLVWLGVVLWVRGRGMVGAGARARGGGYRHVQEVDLGCRDPRARYLWRELWFASTTSGPRRVYRLTGANGGSCAERLSPVSTGGVD